MRLSLINIPGYSYILIPCFSRRGHSKSYDNGNNTANDTYEISTEMTKSALYDSTQMASTPHRALTSDNKCEDESAFVKFFTLAKRCTRCGLSMYSL